MSEVDGVKAINKVTFGQRLKVYKRRKYPFFRQYLFYFQPLLRLACWVT